MKRPASPFLVLLLMATLSAAQEQTWALVDEIPFPQCVLHQAAPPEPQEISP